MKKVTINNIKRIKHLEFFLPDKEGVFLLVGENGAGKTTLLTCLDRICNPRAYATGFSTSKKNLEIDQYIGAEVQYEINDTNVSFKKGAKKWMPTPKKGASELLENFGFSDSVFIKADSRRIDASQEEIAKGRIEAADQTLKTVLNHLFQTERFDKLQRLKIPHGRGVKPTFIYLLKDTKGRYSEKRFSTGELALIRLAEKVLTIKESALVLVDEAEMALHPRIQRRLINFLTEKATEKKLLVILSTHSATLIRETDKDHLILLEMDGDNKINAICPCYPARAIGGVDCIENSGFDCIFFVEDEMAKIYLDSIIKRLRNNIVNFKTFTYAIFPVGGYYETSRIAVDTKNRVFEGRAVYAVLDVDAFDNLEGNPIFHKLYNKHQDIINSLGITPEVWFCEELENSSDIIKSEIRSSFHCEIEHIIHNEEYLSCCSQNERKKAKKKFSILVDKVSSSANYSEEKTKHLLVEILVKDRPLGDLQKTLMPMLQGL